MAEKIRMLFLATNPLESSRLRLGEEFRLINREIRFGPNGHLFDVSSAWAVRPEDLYEMLLAHRPNIVHLSGHATKSRGIILEDDAGGMSPISSQGLAGLFKMFRTDIRMVFLNMCHTKTYVKELAEEVDYVIGIKNKINDRGSIVFASFFYKGLSLGLSIKMAFEVAANQILLQQLPYHDSPMLKIREAINDSVSFLDATEADISDTAKIPFAEREVVDSAIVPVPSQFRGAEYESNNGMKKGRIEKRKKKNKNKKSSMQNKIAELQKEVSNLKDNLGRLTTMIMKKHS